MKKNLLGFIFASTLATSAFATIDTYSTVKYPVSMMQDSGVCLVTSLAHDGITNAGTAQLLAVSALKGPFKIPGIQAGEDSEGLVQVNMLYNQGIDMEFVLDWNSDDMSKAELIIDATAASKNAASVEQRTEVVRLVKTAIVASVTNSLTGLVKQVKLTIKGLPNQKGIVNPIPATFNSSFTKASPYLAGVKKELNIVEGIEKCN